MIPAQCQYEMVKKVWGHEEIVVNDGFCFKRLIVHKGWQVSYHHHKVKDELFYLATGHMTIERNGIIFELKPGQWLRVFPGDWHSFAALKNSVLLEASTHDDPADSYRDPNRLSGKMEPPQ